jgi:threonyl-tRNA synthetase
MSHDPVEGVKEPEYQLPAGYDLDLYRIRHSLAHVLAQAVLEKYPAGKFAIGPPIRDGFYYDFDLPNTPADEELRQIEQRMREILREKHEFTGREVTPEEARALFQGQPYKLELIADLSGENQDGITAVERRSAAPRLTVYQHGSFRDLCRGIHVKNTGEIDPEAFALTHVAGAYWRGNERNKMLSRVYGTAWRNKQELQAHMQRLEDARKRDHRVLGRELGLFTNNDLIGAGLPLWLPRGATVRRLLEEFIEKEERKAGYQHVSTPALAKKQIYEISGHWEHYKDAMFPPIELEHEQLVLRPMNCPHHIMVFANKRYSYRELPVRIAELGTMYRYEKSGVVGGLSRVRVMTLNDAHIFCRPEQVKEEFANVMRLVESSYATLGITQHRYRLSLRDPEDKVKYVSNDKMWEGAERVLREAMQDLKLPYTEAKGEAAFYGPKIDIQLSDLMGREETVSTIQIDFHLPDRFDLNYMGEDDRLHRPVIIHRGVISTMERMTAYLIELYGGAFPVWLAPVQAAVIPVSERHHQHANAVTKRFVDRDFRLLLDASEKTLNAKIRNAQIQKIPFTLVIGDREIENGTVTVRVRGQRDQKTLPVDEFMSILSTHVESRALSINL